MKLVVALTIAAILMALVFQFRNFVGPLIGAFVLAYLIYPTADRLFRRLHLPWRLLVTFLYLLIIVILLGLLAWGGFALVEQVQSLIGFLQNSINDLPNLVQHLASNPVSIGPFILDFNRLDLPTLSNEILGVVQPLLSRVGTMVGSVASSAVTTLGWLFFMLMISYFILSETGGQSNRLIGLHIPGFEEDFDRIGWELNRVWNSFLRGQLIIISMTIALYTMLLGLLGVHYYFGLALVAGMARFIPYVGPLIAWTTYGLVSYFQGVTLFGMPQLTYALMVVAIAWTVDNVIDSLISPRIMADALSIHPAAVMVAALIGVNLLGVVGVVLAAPVLASIKLVLGYIIRKLSDRDPWEDLSAVTTKRPPISISHQISTLSYHLYRIRVTVAAWYRARIAAFRGRKHPRTDL